MNAYGRRVLTQHYICEPALHWLLSQPDLHTAWRKCPKGNWLLSGLWHLRRLRTDAYEQALICECKHRDKHAWVSIENCDDLSCKRCKQWAIQIRKKYANPFKAPKKAVAK